MSSQRHKLVNYGTTAAGEVVAEGEIARSILSQATAPVGDLKEVENGWVIPEGPHGGPLQGSSMSGAIPEDAPVGPTPEPPPGPTISSITPPSGVVGQAVQITITGTGYNAGSTVQADGNGVVSAYVSETQMTASLPSVGAPGNVSITVTTDGLVSLGTIFSFAAAVERSFPEGPYDISGWEYDAGLGGYTFMTGGSSLATGDTVTIEATGTSEVNGSHTVEVLNENKAFFTSAEASRAPTGGRMIITG